MVDSVSKCTVLEKKPCLILFAENAPSERVESLRSDMVFSHLLLQLIAKTTIYQADNWTKETTCFCISSSASSGLGMRLRQIFEIGYPETKKFVR